MARAKSQDFPVGSAKPESEKWRPVGPRPCTDVENEAAIKIVLAVLEKKMTVEEAEGHLHNIFQGRELAP